MEDSQQSLKIGQIINDKWIILEFIAKGGMGEVYRAHQMHLKRDVAIKVISKGWLASTTDNEYELETGLKRFRHEVQAIARVRHPNVLQIYDYGTLETDTEQGHEKLEYIAMEYVPGGTLRDTMSEQGFEDEEDLIKDWLSRYFIPVLEGVKAIHEKKMAHRDLKPGNVLMDGDMPKICDFGLAHSHEWRPVTQSIDIKGTPAYMSPEHFFDFGKADHRSDIYSLGKMLFEAIEGKISPKRPPFKQASLKNPATPCLQKLDEIIRTATDEDKTRRYGTVEQFKAALEESVRTSDEQKAESLFHAERTRAVWTRPPVIWAGIVLAILSVAAMAVWHLVGLPQTDSHRRTQVDGQRTIRPGPVGEQAVGAKPIHLGHDGIQMRLIPEKHADEGAANKLAPFYIDEHPVFNFNFVEFLNEVKSEITVENGVVRGDNQIWFYLGDEKASYEHIIYRHDRFHIKDAAFADAPVVRVTWYGASAYAAHYGKRLPTVSELQYFDSLSESARSDDSPADVPESHSTHMKEGRSVQEMPMGDMMTVPRGSSKDRSRIVGAWAVRKENSRTEPNSEYSSAVVPLAGGNGEAAELRYPWEGFPNVIFRCVISVP